MSFKAIVYLVAVLVFATASIYAGVRSRMRVRALIEEDAEAAKPCTIARPGVARFLTETRMLRQLLAGLIEDATSGIRADIDGNLEAQFDLTNYSRGLHDWIRTYERDLDDEDREALVGRGIVTSSVLSLREPATDVARPGPSLAEMRRHALELDRFEAAMTEVPRLAAYR